MGNASSEEGNFGYRVLGVQPDSPASKIGKLMEKLLTVVWFQFTTLLTVTPSISALFITNKQTNIHFFT